MSPFLYRVKLLLKNYPVTWGLILLNTIAVIVTLIRGGFTLDNLLDLGGLVPILVKEGDYWRLGTSMFLHGNGIHFLMNMMGLYYLGSPLERIMGPGKFFALYLVSGVAGGIAVTLLEDPFTLTIGASGSVYGLMAALLYITFMKKNWFSPASVKSIRTMIVVNFAITFLFPSISVWGHLGGFVVGFLLCLTVMPNVPYFVKKAPPSVRSADPDSDSESPPES